MLDRRYSVARFLLHVLPFIAALSIFMHLLAWPASALGAPPTTVKPSVSATPVLLKPHALVLDDPALVGYDAALGTALYRTLAEAGYDATPVSVDRLQEANTLAPERCALLVVPYARQLPAILISVLDAYAKRGGNLIVLGTPAWQAPSTLLQQGRWRTAEQSVREHALSSPATPFLDLAARFPPAALIRETNTPENRTRLERVSTDIEEQGKERDALQVSIANLNGWDMWRTPDFSVSPFRNGESVTVFSARGGPRTRSLSLEWDERDGSRWIAVVPITTEWRHYALSPADFHGWGVSSEREQAGFHPENAIRFKAGLAFTHTGTVGGAHEYWLAGLGTEAKGGSGDVKPVAAPVLETISPSYKFSSISGSLRLATPADTPLVTAAGWDNVDAKALSGMSSPPRPTGAGFGKGRSTRWQSLLLARDAGSGQWRGVPGTLLVQRPDGGGAGGVWASFSIGDIGFYRQASTQKLLGQVAHRMREGLFLIDGGADAYTVLPGQSVKLGAVFANLSTVTRPVTVRVTVVAKPGTIPIWKHTWSMAAGNRASITTPAEQWTPPPAAMFPPGGYLVTAELRVGNTIIDQVQHRLYLWTPPAAPQFITKSSDGHFYIDGKLWRACGVNYTPSSGIAQENSDLYQIWMDPAAYDPDSVERDLYHIEDLGFNAVSAWVYPGESRWQNLLDFLRRCRAHHLKVSLMLAPVVESPAAADALRPLIEHFRLPENDTVFAYEIAWEPEFNGQDARKPMDGAWEAWVTERYSSVAAAEAAWAAKMPRDGTGKVTNPADDVLTRTDGNQARLAVAYRQFLDDWLARRYGPIVTRLKQIDPRHLVSFRMSHAGDPTIRGRVPYQFEGLAHAVDFLAPEAYGRVGDWEQVKPGWFTVAYARSVAPNLPVVWAEAGMNTWDSAAGSVDPELLTMQGRFYDDFFRMAMESGSDGIFFWWFPGGYRFGEGSDYGVLNPDGTDRPAALAVRRNAAAFRNAPAPFVPDLWLSFSRNAHPDGITGVYDALSPRFWNAIAQGKHPGLRSEVGANVSP